MISSLFSYASSQPGPLALIGGCLLVLIWLIGVSRKAVAALWAFGRKAVSVVNDLFGEEARPGVDARPGIMARMKDSEERDVKFADTLAGLVTTLEHHSSVLRELEPNHGGSIKDKINAVDKRLAKVETNLDHHLAIVEDESIQTP